MYGLRILVADEDAGVRKFLKEQLTQVGYLVIAECDEGNETLNATFKFQPDLLICGTKFSDKSGFEIAKIIEEHRVCPVILISTEINWEVIEKAKAVGAFNCLTKNVTDVILLSAVELANSSFLKIVKIEQENKKLKKNLEAKKIVDKAKALLIEKKGLSEKDAYNYIQRVSMDNCVSKEQVAKKIISLLS